MFDLYPFVHFVIQSELRSGADIYSRLSHGVAKVLMYDAADDELCRDLSLLAAHVYEANLYSKIDADNAAEFYGRADALKYKDKIQELEDYSTRKTATSPIEKEREKQRIVSEVKEIADKYKQQISLESIMGDLNKIREIIRFLLG